MTAPWPAAKIERRHINDLAPYLHNARVHSDEQIEQLAASIKQWGWTIPVLVDEDNGIIAGHGRIMAARKIGLADVPVMVARGWTEEKKRAYCLADNQIALNAFWDTEILDFELGELVAAGLDLSVAGFSVEDLVIDDGGEDDIITMDEGYGSGKQPKRLVSWGNTKIEVTAEELEALERLHEDCDADMIADLLSGADV